MLSVMLSVILSVGHDFPLDTSAAEHGFEQQHDDLRPSSTLLRHELGTELGKDPMQSSFLKASTLVAMFRVHISA